VIRGEKRSNVVVYEIVSEYLVPWIVRKRAELIAEKRRLQLLEEQSRQYIEEFKKREERRWRRRVGTYQLVLLAAVLVIIAGSIRLIWNRALNRANAQIISLQKINRDQQIKIQDLEKRIKSSVRPLTTMPH